jgi:hypothetical protein
MSRSGCSGYPPCWAGAGLELFCGGGGLPVEVAVGEGAACGQGDGGDGQGEGVAVVKALVAASIRVRAWPAGRAGAASRSSSGSAPGGPARSGIARPLPADPLTLRVVPEKRLGELHGSCPTIPRTGVPSAAPCSRRPARSSSIDSGLSLFPGPKNSSTAPAHRSPSDSPREAVPCAPCTPGSASSARPTLWPFLSVAAPPTWRRVRRPVRSALPTRCAGARPAPRPAFPRPLLQAEPTR